VDARAARGCEQCQGLWLEEPMLTEMVLKMLPPQPHSRLLLAVLQRAGERLPCPTCGDPMHATEIHGVELDRCAKHGIWFDKPELEVALQRVADPTLIPPLTSPTPPPPTPAPSADEGVQLWFRIETAGEPMREVEVRSTIVKIGRLPSSHVQLADPTVARMHAVIEVLGASNVVLIDLGSSDGTYVNGERITKVQLHTGDRIIMGATVLTIAIG